MELPDLGVATRWPPMACSTTRCWPASAEPGYLWIAYVVGLDCVRGGVGLPPWSGREDGDLASPETAHALDIQARIAHHDHGPPTGDIASVGRCQGIGIDVGKRKQAGRRELCGQPFE